MLRWLVILLILSISSSINACDSIYDHQTINRRFLAQLPADIAMVWSNKVLKKEIKVRDLVHTYLYQTHKKFHEAIDSFYLGQDVEPLFVDILLNEDISPNLVDYLKNYSLYYLGRFYSKKGETEKAERCFYPIYWLGVNLLTWDSEFYLHYAYNCAITSKVDVLTYKKKIRQAHIFLKLSIGCPDSTEAIQESAILMRDDLDDMSGPLNSLTLRMKSIENAIKQGLTGETTQLAQKGIIDELDKLIDKAMDTEELMNVKKRRSDGGGKSKIKKVGDKKDEIGLMRDRLDIPRNDVMQLMKIKIPEYYREIVNQYFKSLAKDGSKNVGKN